MTDASELDTMLMERALVALSPLIGRVCDAAALAEARQIASNLLNDMLMAGELLPFGDNEAFQFFADPNTGTLVVRLYPTFGILFGPRGK